MFPIPNLTFNYKNSLCYLKLIFALLLILINPSTSHAIETLIYSNDFSSGADSAWSDSRTATANGEKFLGASKYKNFLAQVNMVSVQALLL